MTSPELPNTNVKIVNNEQRDSDWIRYALFIPQRKGGVGSAKTDFDRPGREFTHTNLFFSDTSLGGNRAINPKPQFNDITDPISPSLLVALTKSGKVTETKSYGMGRYYGEAIESNARRIYMQFGIPGFNSLSNFFTNFYDIQQGQLMNTGTMYKTFFTIGKWIGYITLFPVVFTLNTSVFLYKAAASIQNRPLSKFYYVKPNMFLYWSAVTTMVNALAVNMRLIQGIDQNDKTLTDGKTDVGLKPSDVLTLNKLLPDIFKNDKGGIDIFNVATRYQRLLDAHNKAIADIYDSADTEVEIEAKIQAWMAAPFIKSSPQKAKPFSEMVTEYMKSGQATGEGTDDANGSITTNNTNGASPANGATANTTPQPGATDNSFIDSATKLWSGLSHNLFKFKNYATAELQQGGAYVCFNVDHSQTVNESFSNSTRQSDIASSMNDISKSTRQKLFNFANGNLGGGLIGEVISGITGAIVGLVAGGLHVVKADGLAALGGKAFVDIPEMWDDSDGSFANASYNITLRSPYGNPTSIFINILVPLAMLLAGALPRSTGRNSWTSPMLCKLWDPGRCQVDIGIIDSITITRGTGNNGWNLINQATGIDVSFSVKNLSKMLHMPVVSDTSFEEKVEQALGISGIFDEPNNFTNYMAILSGLGVNDQTMFSSKWALARAKSLANFDSQMSASAWASRLFGDSQGRNSLFAYLARNSNVSNSLTKII